MLLAACCAFLVVIHGRFAAPFGNSHDGRNAGVWATGSRALRDDGPIASRVGGVRPDGTSYAHHPPLTYVESAISETVFGEHAWSSKLPALASTLAAAGLLFVLLRDVGLRRVPAAAGAAIGLLSPMLLTYGAMLDTPMTSLVFGVALLVAWQRSFAGRPLPWAVVGALGLLAALSGWEAMLLAWLAGLVLVVQAWRSGGSRAALRAAPMLLGALVGTVLTVGWAVWVYGSLSELHDQLLLRSGDDGLATRAGALDAQTRWLLELFGTAILGLGACAVAAVVDHEVRPVATLALAATLAYPVVLYNGAFYHDYWNYWLVIPIAIGAGWALDRLAAGFAGRGASPTAAGVLVVAITAVIVVPAVLRPSRAARAIDQGVAAGRAASSVAWEASQGGTGDIGRTYEVEPWLDYYARLPYQHFAEPDAFLAFAQAHPDAWILVSNNCADLPDGILCQTVEAGRPLNTDPPEFRMARAGDLAAAYRQAVPN